MNLGACKRVWHIAVVIWGITAVAGVGSGEELHSSPGQAALLFLKTVPEYDRADPREAASLLREAARDKGIDLDHVPPLARGLRTKGGAESPFVISVPASTMEPDEADDAFVRGLNINKSLYQGPIVAVFQYTRGLSVNEVAEILEGGVRIVGRGVGNFYYVLGDASALSVLGAAAYTRWLGAYTVDMKCDAESLPNAVSQFLVTVFVDGEDSQRRELAGLGVEVLRFAEGIKLYRIRASGAKALQVSGLWWVRSVEAVYAPSFDGAGGSALLPENDMRSIEKGALRADYFHPQDSRKLVGTFYSQFLGDDVVVGVHDSGFDLSHNAFALSRNYATIAYAGQDTGAALQHGTAVASIAVGDRYDMPLSDNVFVGNAPQSTLFPIAHTENPGGLSPYEALQEFAEEEACRIANFSYGELDDGGTVFDYSEYTRMFDEFGRYNFVAVVAGGNIKDGDLSTTVCTVTVIT